MFGTVDLFGKTIFKGIVALTMLLQLQACGSSDSKECYYDKVDTMAEVIDIKPSGSEKGRIEVILDFKASKLALEDQELGNLKELQIDQAFVERNLLKIGNQYEVRVSEITSGECIPRIVSFYHSFE